MPQLWSTNSIKTSCAHTDLVWCLLLGDESNDIINASENEAWLGIFIDIHCLYSANVFHNTVQIYCHHTHQSQSQTVSQSSFLSYTYWGQVTYQHVIGAWEKTGVPKGKAKQTKEEHANSLLRCCDWNQDFSAARLQGYLQWKSMYLAEYQNQCNHTAKFLDMAK